LQCEIYEAAELLFLWTQETAGPVAETAYVGLPDGVALDLFYDYPAYQLGGEEAQGDGARRGRLLAQMFDAYAGTRGNDALRFTIMEALALGLSRAMGHAFLHAEALVIVDRALAVHPHSIHLKTARHALGLRLGGKKVPLRMEKFIGRDNGHMKQFVCPLPFERFDITPSGD